MPASPQPIETLWVLRKDDQEARAEVRRLGDIGQQLRFSRNGELASTRVFRRHEVEQLQQIAAAKRSELEAKGWA